MPGALYKYLADDHDRLDGLLRRALAQAQSGQAAIDAEAYHEFRKGILRHIGIEEKIVLPAMVKRLGRKPDVAEQLHRDHGAIVACLAPLPSPSILLTIASILETHNRLEEQERGLYKLLEEAAGPEAEHMLAQMVSAPPVAVLPNNDKPEVLQAAKNAVELAGHKFKEA